MSKQAEIALWALFLMTLAKFKIWGVDPAPLWYCYTGLAVWFALLVWRLSNVASGIIQSCRDMKERNRRAKQAHLETDQL